MYLYGQMAVQENAQYQPYVKMCDNVSLFLITVFYCNFYVHSIIILYGTCWSYIDFYFLFSEICDQIFLSRPKNFFVKFHAGKKYCKILSESPI